MKVEAIKLHLPNYSHQITMRVIDYFTVQIKEVVLNPFTFNEYHYKNGKSSTHTRMYRMKTEMENKMTET